LTVPPAHKPAAPFDANLVGVALEDYFHVGAFDRLIERGRWERFESRLERTTQATLELLDQHHATATFFTLGWVADQHPDLLRAVRQRGHEIANAGYAHVGIDNLDAASLERELRNGHEAIERATGVSPIGVRIPDFLRARDRWALDVIARLGYAYDASFRPLGLDRWRRNVARHPFVHHVDDHALHVFPVPTLGLGPWLLPIGGGNWFRQLPQFLVRRAVHRWTGRHATPFAMYFHAWELDQDQPRITAASSLSRLRHYRNLDRADVLLREVLAARPSMGFAQHLGLVPPAGEAAPPPTRAAGSFMAAKVSSPAPPTASRAPLPATVVVPCFNEAETLPYLIRTLDGVKSELCPRWTLSFVFVDDGSSDATWRKLQSLVGHRADCQLVQHPGNRGIAAAILTGIRASADEFVCSIDADCTYDPHRVVDLLNALEDGADLVTASPYHPLGTVRHVPSWRLGLSRTLSALYRRRLGSPLHTFTSCFRGYRKSHFVGTRLLHEGFLGIAELLAAAIRSGARVTEVPATLEARLIGYSKLKVLRVIAGHLRLLHSLTPRATPPALHTREVG
jgi:polysaccharide deacetylase family protein (PEP-CTERM system associated)